MRKHSSKMILISCRPSFIHLFFYCCIIMLPQLFPTGIIKVDLICPHSWAGVWKSRVVVKKKKAGCLRPPTGLTSLRHITCLTTAACGHGTLSKSLNCVSECYKSLSQLFVCAEVVENVACLSQGVFPGLSQGLVDQARWSGWGCRLPFHLLLLLSPLPPSTGDQTP